MSDFLVGSFETISSVIKDNSQTLFTIAIAYAAYYIYSFGSRDSRLPPGPPTVPVLGNLDTFPRSYLHFKFTEWSKQYGDIYSLKVLNKTVIVVSSPTAMKEVIEKRSAATSNRPKSILADMITPNNLSLGTGRFAGHTWKVLRKPVTQLLSKDNIYRHRHVLQAETSQLIFDLMNSPENWYRHMNRTIFSLACSLTYGSRAPRTDSVEVREFLAVHEQFINALELGRMPPVDLFPILSLVPARWAKWKQHVKAIHDEENRILEKHLARVESRLSRGLETPGFMEELIRNAESWDMTDRDYLRNFGAPLLQGSDTTVAGLQSTILLLVHFLDVQSKACEEMDRVVGPDRMPTWDDLPNLPYTMAVVEEVNRFRPVGPLGVPHEMVEDQIINGMLFPKDAAIFVNYWGMFHDDRYFDRPDEFIPERWLNNPLGVQDTAKDDPARRPNIVFGGGRRVCPGLPFATKILELSTARFIWAFEFRPPVHPSSKQEVPPGMSNYSSGMTSIPVCFDCQIIPRSKQRCDIIRRQFAADAEFLAPFELDLGAEDRKYNATHRRF